MVCKRCLVTVRKRCSVNNPVKRFLIYPHLYYLLISVYEKSQISVKPPYFHVLRPLTDRPCGPGICTDKNFRRIKNPEKGFITEKRVYQRTLPLDKPFFLEKPKKGLLDVAN